MPQRIRKLRFPDGDSEYRTTEADLKVGTIIRSRGTNWVIASVTDGLAVLEWPHTNGDGDGAVQLPALPPAKHGAYGRRADRA